ncbi:MAG: ABC transporter permease [Thermoguttaceae bacterium]|nr:ABC transporter permease [Thermoguttaceae bacterium]
MSEVPTPPPIRSRDTQDAQTVTNRPAPEPSPRKKQTTPGWDRGLVVLGCMVIRFLETLGSLTLFSFRTFWWSLVRGPGRKQFVACSYQIGFQSMPVIALTGMFVGMVLAVQSYSSFRMMGMESRLGAVINMALVRELGPVLAAVMLAGRIGCAMAAEIGTMRVTEQIDALASMGADPLHHLVVPRFLASISLIPALNLVANGTGVIGGWLYCCWLYDVDSFYYFENSRTFVTLFDLGTGLTKSLFFGGAIALIACHQGFHCEPGADGVGKAATRSFVQSFVAILFIDLIVAVIVDRVYLMIWPGGPKLF